MRWEALFRDLEAAFDEAASAELAGEVAERARAEVARLRLVDRLRPALGHPLSVRVAGAGVVRGQLAAVGPDWLLLIEAPGGEVLVAAAAVLSLTGLGAYSAEPGSEGAVAARFGLRLALGGMVRSRASARVVLVDGEVVSGTPDRIGADFLDIAEHPADEPRRPGAVRAVRTIPLAAVGLLRSGW